MMKKIILILVSGVLYGSLFSQNEGVLQLKTQTFFSPRYTFQVPGGDLADRFGVNSSLGVTFGTKRVNGLYLGGNVNFMFGNDVKEPNLIQNLISSNGEIISTEGKPATVLIQQRGFYFSSELGKFFKFKSAKTESGILASFGVGFLQHNIRFEHQLDDVPQLDGDYEKGYDRLTNGLMLSQNLGWMFFSPKRGGDFYIGLEVMEGFTASRREFNFDTLESEKGKSRLDLLFGVKVAWIVPFYKKNLYY